MRLTPVCLIFCCVAAAALAVSHSSVILGEELKVPRRHDRPPGPPVSAEEAVAKMTVPEGFEVEIVAAEPAVVNPVSMFIDEQGRYWVTESLEYPRRSSGPGRDRVKVLEDTDGDGRVDRTTVFADGLNIPSGIAVGYGGVWVANAPDLLFLRDTDGDLVADEQEVVVTGFGRTDTHELPNSFTWGPDGWLYGLNGVFNRSHVKYSPANPNYSEDQPGWKFTCAMWRVHPRTREFQVFAEGTSNPWGIAIDDRGEFFISACVIDHLWHIVEDAYYIRQGGPYPPHTWPMRSIVNHRHQKAAYCGITWFDSPAYPDPYRGVLLMGNIHGGCINADVAVPDGASYKAAPHPGFPPKPGAWDQDEFGTIRKRGDAARPQLADFLTANDPWFMPVVQKVGPDGSLYILDWYDRYHCYQDANADPAGIERERGRLYRVRYEGTPRAAGFNLAAKSNDELITLLGDPNVFIRETAQRLLGERNDPEAAGRLLALVQDDDQAFVHRRHALSAYAGMSVDGRTLADLVRQLDEPALKALALRILCNEPTRAAEFGLSVVDELLEHDPATLSPRMRRELVIVLAKLPQVDHRVEWVLSLCAVEEDPMLMHLGWEVTREMLDSAPSRLLAGLVKTDSITLGKSGPIVTRAVEGLGGEEAVNHRQLAGLIARVIDAPEIPEAMRRDVILAVVDQVRDGGFSERQEQALREVLMETLLTMTESAELAAASINLRALWGDAAAQEMLREAFADRSNKPSERLEALATLVEARDESVLPVVQASLADGEGAADFRGRVIESLGNLNHPQVADVLLATARELEPELQFKVWELMTQRPVWTAALLSEMLAGRIDKSQLNLNQLKRVASFKSDEVQTLLARVYGRIRLDERSDRQAVIRDLRRRLANSEGDPHAGVAVFRKVCAQCHKMYGEGAEVGPDITRNGRNNWDQLLQNVFDPSAVIGPGYQARMLVTIEGRVLTGLPVEESEDRVVLKVQGGKLETIPRDEIEGYKVSEVSMMPEQLEKLISPQEMADLMAYLALDRPPHEEEARLLPGAPAQGKP